MVLDVGNCGELMIYLAEEQGVLSPQAPGYIKSVRGIPTEQHGSDKDGEEFVVPSLLKV
jgi:hypothetical protein